MASLAVRAGPKLLHCKVTPPAGLPQAASALVQSHPLPADYKMASELALAWGEGRNEWAKNSIK